MPSGNLILEEFTDAATSLKWDNEYAIDINFSSKVTMESVIPAKMRPELSLDECYKNTDDNKDVNGGKRKRNENDEIDSDLEMGEDDGDEREEEWVTETFVLFADIMYKGTMWLSYFQQDKIFSLHLCKLVGTQEVLRLHTLVFGRKALRGGSYPALCTLCT